MTQPYPQKPRLLAEQAAKAAAEAVRATERDHFEYILDNFADVSVDQTVSDLSSIAAQLPGSEGASTFFGPYLAAAMAGVEVYGIDSDTDDSIDALAASLLAAAEVAPGDEGAGDADFADRLAVRVLINAVLAANDADDNAALQTATGALDDYATNTDGRPN